MNEEFAVWLDNVLKGGLPEGGAAVNFNIYEDGDGDWSIQFILSSEYDRENDDWACDELFSSEEDIFEFHLEDEWEKAQEKAVDLISDYLENGEYRNVLKSYSAVCTGFVDGALLMLYPDNTAEE